MSTILTKARRLDDIHCNQIAFSPDAGKHDVHLLAIELELEPAAEQVFHLIHDIKECRLSTTDLNRHLLSVDNPDLITFVLLCDFKNLDLLQILFGFWSDKIAHLLASKTEDLFFIELMSEACFLLHQATEIKLVQR